MLQICFYLIVWVLMTILMLGATVVSAWRFYYEGWPPICWVGLFCWGVAMFCYCEFTRATIWLIRYDA